MDTIAGELNLNGLLFLNIYNIILNIKLNIILNIYYIITYISKKIYL